MRMGNLTAATLSTRLNTKGQTKHFSGVKMKGSREHLVLFS